MKAEASTSVGMSVRRLNHDATSHTAAAAITTIPTTKRLTKSPTATNAGRGIPTGGIGAATTGHTSFHLMGEEPAITWRNRRRVLPIHDASSEEALNDWSKTSQIALD